MIRRFLSMPRTPVTIAVLLSLGIVSILLIIGTAIGVEYVLMINYVNHLTQQQQAAQRAGGVNLCRAVLQMDLASKGATFPSSSGGSSYGRKLAAAIHELYVSSGCPKVIG